MSKYQCFVTGYCEDDCEVEAEDSCEAEEKAIQAFKHFHGWQFDYFNVTLERIDDEEE